jgi:hypothetical protein
MLEVAEADLELEAGLCPCERGAGHAEIARPSSSTRTNGVPGLTIARWVASRAARVHRRSIANPGGATWGRLGPARPRQSLQTL